MIQNHLIYHPKREITQVNGLTIHHDKFGGNEDPYVWNDRFLHTYCHITQLHNEEGQINFWVSGDEPFPRFNKLYCDCVFVIAKKCDWTSANQMSRRDPIVENTQTYEHHYKWGDEKYGHHQLKKKGRYTLKADPDKSFQPQDKNGNLIDILPFLMKNGVKLNLLRAGMTATIGSKPFLLSGALGQQLYDYLFRTATIKLTGKQMAPLHPYKTKTAPGSSNACC